MCDYIINPYVVLIKESSQKTDDHIAIEHNKETPIAPHQMTKCFKLGIN
jgi:hypothetical protein